MSWSILINVEVPVYSRTSLRIEDSGKIFVILDSCNNETVRFEVDFLLRP